MYIFSFIAVVEQFSSTFYQYTPTNSAWKFQFLFFSPTFGILAILAPPPTFFWSSLWHVGFSSGMWDLSSPIKDRTQVPCTGRWILNHWTTREVPFVLLICISLMSNNNMEKEMATHSSTLAWKITWTSVHGVAKSWTRLSDFTYLCLIRLRVLSHMLIAT